MYALSLSQVIFSHLSYFSGPWSYPGIVYVVNMRLNTSEAVSGTGKAGPTELQKSFNMVKDWNVEDKLVDSDWDGGVFSSGRLLSWAGYRIVCWEEEDLPSWV